MTTLLGVCADAAEAVVGGCVLKNEIAARCRWILYLIFFGTLSA